jgi:hypothetical protein
VDFEKEPAAGDEWSARPSRYVLQKIISESPEAWRGLYSAYDLETYTSIAMLNGRFQKVVMKRGASRVLGRPLSDVVAVTP